jgi:MFS family permease
VWHLAAVSLVDGVALGLYYPAYSALVPALVPESELLAANGLEGVVRPVLAQAAGPAAAGLLVASLSPGAALAATAGAALAAAACLRALPTTPVRRDLAEAAGSAVGGLLRDVREGFGYMVRTPWLLATLLFASLMLLVFIGPFEVLVPFAVQAAGGGPSQHAAVLMAFGIGGAVGSLLMASLTMPRRYLTLMNLMWGVGCLPFLVFGFATAVWQIVVSAFVLGALFSAPMVIWGTLLQRRVPPHMLGRVASLDFFVSVSLMPVSMALAGPVSEAIGLRTTFAIAGIAPGVFALLAVVLARLPEDELAHPLRDDEEEPAAAPEVVPA